MIEIVSSQVELEPVIKKIQVRLPLEAAFRLFTEGFGRWWPLATHSVSEAEAASCTLEGRPGGRIYEVHQDGRQFQWGVVRRWEPPRRLVFSWHPGRTEETAQEVEVSFSSAADGTQVELVHRGWERLGKRAAKIHAGYVTGWDYVLGKFVGLCDEL